MVDVAEGAGPVERLHNLLLALTGRVDDDAVNSVREMLGLGQLDAAAEFLVGCLLAGRIPVTSTEQYHLRRALEEARSQHTLADRLNVVETVPDEGHRFSEQHEGSDHDLVEALAPIAGRLHGVRALWCAWRTTPAGITYGAVPRRVLLAEVGADGSVAAAGYQLIEALRRAGVGCSVDVFNSGMDLPPYHRNALATARRVHLDLAPQVSVSGGSNHARAPRATAGAGSKAGGGDVPSEPAAGPGRGAEAPVPEPAAHDSARPETAPELGHRAEQAVADPAPRAEVSRPEPARAEARAESARAESVRAEAHAEPEPARSEPARAEPVRAEPAHAEPAPAEAFDQLPQLSQDEPARPAEEETAHPTGEQTGQPGGKNTRVPAAVDAKLTDRERNLLRKLHEELAQREQDKGAPAGDQVATGGKPAAAGGQEGWTSTMPGSATGGFPSIGANQERGKQR